MKKITVLMMLFFSMAIHQQSNAQFRISINFGIQPNWGPVGYDHVDYYYMPDIDAYYYVPQRQFIYMERNEWVFASSLPPRYNDFDLYNGYKVVINEPRPYLHNNVYRTRYNKYKGGRQEIIRDSYDTKYGNNRHGHEDHEDRGHDNGKRHHGKPY